MFTPELIDRIRERAADPARRTEFPDPTMMPAMRVGTAFSTTKVNIGGMLPPEPSPLPPPAAGSQLTELEHLLGFAFPDDLKQVYLDIADGGFGPNGGLAPIADCAKWYRKLVAEPQGEGGQDWSANLFPICFSEPGIDCYDRESGAIVFWDVESLENGPGDRVWRASFRPVAKSMADWFADWLERPLAIDEMAAENDRIVRENMHETLQYWRAMTSDQRRECGLPDEGWEEALFGHLGIDLKGL